jgi:hypothetical protein
MASVSAFCYTEAQPVDILKIATFNINGIRSRLPALLEWLEREGPDHLAQRRTGATAPQCRRRSLGPRPAPCKRPRADLDRARYGREEGSETAAQHGQAVQHSVG